MMVLSIIYFLLKERISNTISQEITPVGGRIIQTTDKGQFIQLVINPPKPPGSKSTNVSNKKSNNEPSGDS